MAAQRIGISNLTPEEERRFMVHGQLRETGGDPSQLLMLLALIVEKEDWTRLRDEEGAPLTFEKYLLAPFPVGIGWRAEEADLLLRLRHRYERGYRIDPKVVKRLGRMRERVRDLLPKEAVLAEAARETGKLSRAGGDRTNGEQGDYITLPRGTTGAEYLIARIARDRPDILERMQAGEFKSARAAAIAAGLIRVPTPLQKVQRAWRAADADERRAIAEWIESER